MEVNELKGKSLSFLEIKKLVDINNSLYILTIRNSELIVKTYTVAI